MTRAKADNAPKTATTPRPRTASPRERTKAADAPAVKVAAKPKVVAKPKAAPAATPAAKASPKTEARQTDRSAPKTTTRAPTHMPDNPMRLPMFKSFDDWFTLYKANMDACIASAGIFSKGMESVAHAVFAFNKTAYEQGLANTKALLGATTLQEVYALQNRYAKVTYEDMVAEGTKISEMGMKVANEAMAPLAERFNVTVGTLVKEVKAA